MRITIPKNVEMIGTHQSTVADLQGRSNTPSGFALFARNIEPFEGEERGGESDVHVQVHVHVHVRCQVIVRARARARPLPAVVP